MFGSFPSACKLVFTVQLHTLLAWKRNCACSSKEKTHLESAKEKGNDQNRSWHLSKPKGPVGTPVNLKNFLHHLCLTNDRDTAVLPKSLSLEPLQTGNLLLLHNQHSMVAAFFSS
ncbi:unnamed protein product [Eretmochelys imbricata]